MTPREPWGSEDPPDESIPQEKSTDPDAWIFAEFQTPRVSFSPSILKCVQAVYANMHPEFQSPKGLKFGLEFAVFRFDTRSHSRVLTPEDLSKKRSVWDAHITEEYCFLDPVQVYFCGTVMAKVAPNIKGMMVIPFNDKKMKPISSIVPTAEEVSLVQTLRLRGEKCRIKLY